MRKGRLVLILALVGFAAVIAYQMFAPFGTAYRITVALGLDDRWNRNEALVERFRELEREPDLATRARGLVQILAFQWSSNEEGPNPRFVADWDAIDALVAMGPEAVPYLEEGLQSTHEPVRRRCQQLLTELATGVEGTELHMLAAIVEITQDGSGRVEFEMRLAPGGGLERLVVEPNDLSDLPLQTMLRTTGGQAVAWSTGGTTTVKGWRPVGVLDSSYGEYVLLSPANSQELMIESGPGLWQRLPDRVRLEYEIDTTAPCRSGLGRGRGYPVQVRGKGVTTFKRRKK